MSAWFLPRQRASGYVALLTVLIVGAAATAIAVVLLAIGADTQRSTLVEQQSKQARSLAVACVQEALQQLHDNIALTTTNSSLTMGQGSCTYNVTTNTATTRTITAIGTVNNAALKIIAGVTVGTTTNTISSWKEVTATAATITNVQSVGSSASTGATTIAQAFASNTTAGNLIVAAVSWDTTSASTLMCTDTQGDAFATVMIVNDTVGTQALGVCYAPNIKGGADTVTATFNASSTSRRIIVSEYSGLTALTPFDTATGVGGATATTGTDAVSSGSVTTSQDSELVYGAVMDTSGTTTITAGTGFAQRYSLNAKDLAIQDLQQTLAGSIASTQTFGATHNYDAVIATFKAASQ